MKTLKSITRGEWLLILLAPVLFTAMLAHMDRTASASEFPAARAFDTVAQTWTIPTLTTNATNVSIFVEANNQHTIQTVCTGTNAIYVIHERSLDGSHWILFSTNNVDTNATAETTATGKWSYLRTRFYGTNSAASVLYLGGR